MNLNSYSCYLSICINCIWKPNTNLIITNLYVDICNAYLFKIIIYICWIMLHKILIFKPTVAMNWKIILSLLYMLISFCHISSSIWGHILFLVKRFPRTWFISFQEKCWPVLFPIYKLLTIFVTTMENLVSESTYRSIEHIIN